MKKSTRNNALAIGALGVVFGDIGTSPLYALQAIFGANQQHMAINHHNVLGVISLVIWSITIIVSIKYIAFIMRANNQGEGGIIALIALVKSNKSKISSSAFFILLGLIGLALFYGDSIITPAISVLSAVEGLHIIAPSLGSYIIPITLVILTLLFGIQKYGTHVIGKLFGPIMLIWFLVIGLGGLWQVIKYPSILLSLSPFSAIDFVLSRPITAFIAMGAVVLVITGAEALYADMGHFGRKPITKAWFIAVFPALLFCYMGQGVLLLNNPQAVSSPLFLLYPEFLRAGVVILATCATLIASQAVISGAFSLTRQAVHLNFLPKMIIRHTSLRETGQVYLPFINISLFIFVSLLVLVFGTSQKLAGAYGMAVSATLAIDTILFIVVARYLWQKSRVYVAILLVSFITVDLIFVIANVSKIFKGGWFSIAVAGTIMIIITTWLKGQKVVTRERKALEGPLQPFIDQIRRSKPPIARIPGSAVYVGHHADLAPLALRATVEKLHELHERVIILSVHVADCAHVPVADRAELDNLQYNDDGISHVSLTYGFHDTINIPKTLNNLRHVHSELDIDPNTAVYFVSLGKVVQTNRNNMASWRKAIYKIMVHNATSSSDYYKLPTDRTVEMSSLIEL